MIALSLHVREFSMFQTQLLCPKNSEELSPDFQCTSMTKEFKREIERDKSWLARMGESLLRVLHKRGGIMKGLYIWWW